MSDPQALGLNSMLNLKVQRLASRMALQTTRQVLAGTDVNIGEWRVLCHLKEAGSMNLTSISQLLALDAGRASRLLKTMEHKSLVVRKPNRKDARGSIFTLTKKAHRKFDDAWPRALRVSDDVRELFSDRELAQLDEFLERAIRHISDSLDERSR